MCLHGLEKSGQSQEVIKSASRAGNSATPASAKHSSASGGSTPAINRAAIATFDAIALPTLRHWAIGIRLSSIVTW